MVRTTVSTTAGLLLGLGAAHLVACGDESDDPRAITTCREYCERSAECDDRDQQNCEENCRQIVDDCMDDEVDEVLDLLDTCAAEACNEFTECTAEAGAQCLFGL